MIENMALSTEQDINFDMENFEDEEELLIKQPIISKKKIKVIPKSSTIIIIPCLVSLLHFLKNKNSLDVFFFDMNVTLVGARRLNQCKRTC